MSKVKKAWLVAQDGSVQRLPHIENLELSLKAMYPIIGGCDTIEHVGLKKGVDMWVDEEGLLKERYLNAKATELYRAAYPHVPPRELVIVGNAIVTDNTKNGDFIK